MLLKFNSRYKSVLTFLNINNKNIFKHYTCLSKLIYERLWGVSVPGGESALGGVCYGGCLLQGVSAPGGMSAPGGVCSRGEGLLLGGGLLWGVWYPSMH